MVAVDFGDTPHVMHATRHVGRYWEAVAAFLAQLPTVAAAGASPANLAAADAVKTGAATPDAARAAAARAAAVKVAAAAPDAGEELGSDEALTSCVVRARGPAAAGDAQVTVQPAQ